MPDQMVTVSKERFSKVDQGLEDNEGKPTTRWTDDRWSQGRLIFSSGRLPPNDDNDKEVIYLSHLSAFSLRASTSSLNPEAFLASLNHSWLSVRSLARTNLVCSNSSRHSDRCSDFSSLKQCVFKSTSLAYCVVPLYL